MREEILKLIEAKRNIWSDTTLSSEQSRVRTLLKYGFPDVTPKELLDKLLPLYSRYTVKQLFLRAKEIDRKFKFGLNYDIFLENNPEVFRGVYEGRVTVLSDSDIKTILEEPKPDWLHNAIILMTFAGLRKSETLHVRWSNIENNYLEVIQGKGRKNRLVPFLPIHQARLRSNGSFWVLYRDKWLLRGPQLKSRLGYNLGLLSKSCGIKFTPHDLRAYCLQKAATVLTQKELQDFAGHASFQTTLKYLVVDKANVLKKLAGLDSV